MRQCNCFCKFRTIRLLLHVLSVESSLSIVDAIPLYLHTLFKIFSSIFIPMKLAFTSFPYYYRCKLQS